MRDLKIAIGNSRQARFWSNKTMSFEDICDRLKTPISTTETAEEYARLPKSKRDEIKDKGGFVGGHLKDNLRKAGNVVCRSLWTPDLDNATPEFVAALKERLNFKCVVYSTHSHTPQSPRLRIVAPFARDVSSDEFTAISRFMASEIGIGMFDECSFIPNQLMYWPTCPSNGEYVCEVFEGDALEPDAILSEHPNWRDCSLLPTTSRESKAGEPKGKVQEDPLSKKGIVGAFCRTYCITNAMETFLSEIYAPSAMEGRYDYIAGESTAGVVVYEDKWAYSHHATDPACGMLLNAFDLVRVHRFGNGDANKSFSQMSSFALEDEKVKLLLAQERMTEANNEFQEGEAWMKQLKYGKGAILENSVWNLALILQNDPDFAGFAFNELAGRVQITGRLPWDRPEGNLFWREADTAQIKALIDSRYLPFSTRNHDVAFAKVADDRHFHPIRDYLAALPDWDGKKRVESLFIDYLKADDTEYVRTVTRKAFAAMVARIYRPGVKFDSVPVLDGEQGIGKSTIVKDLVSPEYYSESLSLTDMDDKSGAEKLQGFWVVEIGELAGMKKADIEKVKAFLSTADDKYRPSYGKTVESHPRQCVIIATVNGERGYLRDITGNRRFWIIKLHQQKQRKKWDFDKSFRDQFWAEAKAICESGEKLYLEGEILDVAEAAQREAMEVDERIGMVEEYLAILLPEDWETKDLYERRNFLDSSSAITSEKGSAVRASVSNAELWCECFGRSLQDLKPTDSYAIAALMAQIPGWERSPERAKQAIYGRQRLYRRSN
jgi:putative DNA primase/helicase